ncbi:MAG: hypothetical protein R3B68_03555 [Phycisphaerales bacterium]
MTRQSRQNQASESLDRVNLILTAWFAARGKHECPLVSDTAEDLLVLANDRKARALLAESMGRPLDEPLRRIPTDDVLAPLLQLPLDRLRKARATGLLDAYVSLGRTAGRRPMSRTSAFFEWYSPYPIPSDPSGERDDARLHVQLTPADLPAEGARGIQAFADRFFRRAAQSGVCSYAEARLVPYHYRNWHRSGSIGEPPELVEFSNADLRYALGPARREHVPTVRHISMLSKQHLARLGGREAFAKEIRAFRATDPPGGAPHAKVMPNGMILVSVERNLLEEIRDPWELESIAIDSGVRSATWLLTRYMQAGLLFAQAPNAMEAMARQDAAFRAELEKGRQKEAAELLEAEIAQREADFAVFMQRMWDNPPTCVAHAAQPVTKAQRSALSGSHGSHGQNMTAFRIARPGSKEPIGLWGPISSRGEFWYPYYLGGPTEQAALAVFDPSRHGFDGEHGNARRILRKTPDAYHCVRCGHDRFHVTTMFEYAEPEEATSPEEQARPQDFFTWFVLIAACAGCKHRSEVGSVECA